MKPTANLRHILKASDRGFHLHQWWVDDQGHGEWRAIEVVHEGIGDCDAPPTVEQPSDPPPTPV